MNNEFDFLARLKLRISYFRIITTSDPRTRDSNYEYKQGTGYVRFLGYYGQMGQEDLTDLRILSEKSLTYINYESNRKDQANKEFQELKKRYAVYRHLWKKYNGLTFISQESELEAESEIRNTLSDCIYYRDTEKPFKDEHFPTAIIDNSFWDDMKDVLDENEKEIDHVLSYLKKTTKITKPTSHRKRATTRQNAFLTEYLKTIEVGLSPNKAVIFACKKVQYSESQGKNLKKGLEKGILLVKYKNKLQTMVDGELTPI
jgi:vacuolar-type H+-ATPase subunit I/STV1